MHVILLTLKTCLCILFILISGSLLRAQYMDSLEYILRGRHSLDFRIESRNATVNHKLVGRTGFRVGLTFSRKLRIGAGLSWLASPLISDLNPPVIENDSIVHNLFVKLTYVCYYVDVVFYKTKLLQLSVPLQFGTGSEWLEDPLLPPDQRVSSKHFVVLYEPGITTQYKLTTWLGAGVDVTYLFIFPGSKTIEKLSSLTVTFKVLFWADHLFYEIFPNSRITKRFGPAYW